MDKLQPIIKQRFWILLGLCLILALFGFFRAQSQIVAATKSREEQLKAALSAIPSGAEPNTTYSEGLKVINDAYEKKIKAAIDDLFASQMARMTWPEKIAKEIPKDPKGVPYYRSKDHVLSTIATRNYSEIYKDLIEELWKKAEPVVEREVPNVAAPGVIGGPNRNAELYKGYTSGALRVRGPKNRLLKGQTILYGHQGQPPVTWQQKVYIDRQAVPQKVLDRIPSADQVWDCQEDIWFTELLFEAVRKTNKDAENALTSPVRMISKIELRGGAGAGAAPAGDMGMGGEMAGMEGEMGMSSGMSMGMGGAGMGVAGAGAMLPPPPTAFDPADVFGPDTTGMGGAGGSEDMAMADPAAEGGMGMSMAMGPPPALRWVGSTEGQPYRERGFYLSVIVNQQRIPDFLVNLCESAWPTKVLRFQMGPNPYKKEVTGGMAGMGYDPYGAGALMGESAGAYGGGMPMNIGGSMAEMAMGMGGMGMGGMSSVSRYPGGPPTFTNTPKDPFNGSLNNPDLVQLDIAGIITFYVSSEAAAEAGAPAVDTPSAPGGDASLLTPPADGSTATPPAAAAPADGAAPATPSAETTPPATPPAGNAAPATPPATTTPPAAESPATPPAGAPAADAPAATAPPAAAPATPPPAEPAPPPS